MMAAMGILLVQLDGRAECFTAAFAIGRRDCALAVDDEYASPRHAACRPDGDGWLIEDLGSMNGTFLNGQKVYGPRRLAKGDTVRVGHTDLVMVPD